MFLSYKSVSIIKYVQMVPGTNKCPYNTEKINVILYFNLDIYMSILVVCKC